MAKVLCVLYDDPATGTRNHMLENTSQSSSDTRMVRPRQRRIRSISSQASFSVRFRVDSDWVGSWNISATHLW